MRQLIRHLEDALALADEIQDGHAGYLIDVHPEIIKRGTGEVTFSDIDELAKAMRRGARKSSRTVGTLLRGLADKNSWKCDEESS